MKLENNIFKIITDSGSGTGFFLKGYDYIITNYHVVAGFREVIIEDNQKNRYLSKVVMVNSLVDIAFLVVKDMPIVEKIIELNPNLHIETTQEVNIAGYPFGMPFVITKGIISSIKQIMDNRYYIQTDAAINSGNSGGPMIDKENNLVAVVNSKFTEADNVGFGIPFSDIQSELDNFTFKDEVYRVKCVSCNNYIEKRVKFCDKCGKDINEKLFDTLEKEEDSQLTKVVEKAIANYGLNPKLCRVGKEFWEFYPKSNVIRFFTTNGEDSFYANSPICSVPKENIEEALKIINGNKVKPFNLGIYAKNNTICLYYRIFQFDVTNDVSRDEVMHNLELFISKSIKLSEYFIQKFNADVAIESK